MPGRDWCPVCAGGEVRTEGAEIIGTVLGSEAAGDFLFHLGHAHGLIGKIIREGDVGIGSESPDIVGVGAQVQEQIGRLTLSCPTAFAGFFDERIGRFTGGKDFRITGAKVGAPFRRQRAADRIHLVAGGSQQVDHLAGPSLFIFLEDVGQFAIRFPAVVDQRSQETRENGLVIERLFAPLDVTRDPGQRLRSKNVHPVQRTGHAHSRLIRVGDRSRLNRVTHGVDRGLQANPGVFAGGQHRRLGHRIPRPLKNHHESATLNFSRLTSGGQL